MCQSFLGIAWSGLNLVLFFPYKSCFRMSCSLFTGRVSYH